MSQEPLLVTETNQSKYLTISMPSLLSSQKVRESRLDEELARPVSFCGCFQSPLVSKMVTRGYYQGYALLTSVVFAVLYITGVAIGRPILTAVGLLALCVFGIVLLMVLSTSFRVLAMYGLLAVGIAVGVSFDIPILNAVLFSLVVISGSLRLANFVSQTWRFLALRKHIAQYLADTGQIDVARSIVSNEADMTDILHSMQTRLRVAEEEIENMRRAFLIEESDITLKHVIGKGAFGEVWEADSMVCDRPVAVKMLREQVLFDTNEATTEFLGEIEFLRNLRHRNIVLFHGAGTRNGLPFLVTEFLQRGSLRQLLANASIPVPPSLMLSFALDTARGMAFLHSQNPPRVHRDLKSGNLLVSDSWVVKVTDFGTSKIVGRNSHTTTLPPIQTSVPSSGVRAAAAATVEFMRMVSGREERGATRDETREMTQNVGTSLWMAPEVHRGESEYGGEIDVYSFGIVLWEIIMRSVPYEHLRTSWAVREFVVGGGRPTRPPPTLTEEYNDLMEACWRENPMTRPLFNEIVPRLQRIHLPAEMSKEPVS